MDVWLHEDPPRAYKDHVHLTAVGYAWAADLLLDELTRGYAARSRVLPPLPSLSPASTSAPASAPVERVP